MKTVFFEKLSQILKFQILKKIYKKRDKFAKYFCEISRKKKYIFNFLFKIRIVIIRELSNKMCYEEQIMTVNQEITLDSQILLPLV